VVFAKIQDSVESLGRDVSDLVIACFGLSFKRDVDDFRGSPAVDVVEKVLKEGFKDVMLVEPHLKQILPGNQFSSARLVDSAEALRHADILVLLVDHEEFRILDTRLRKAAIVIDTRGIWN
jgi:UDP-N-acetyl-D-mannosaminuronic acid dehydrogenase